MNRACTDLGECGGCILLRLADDIGDGTRLAHLKRDRRALGFALSCFGSLREHLAGIRVHIRVVDIRHKAGVLDLLDRYIFCKSLDIRDAHASPPLEHVADEANGKSGSHGADCDSDRAAALGCGAVLCAISLFWLLLICRSLRALFSCRPLLGGQLFWCRLRRCRHIEWHRDRRDLCERGIGIDALAVYALKAQGRICVLFLILEDSLGSLLLDIGFEVHRICGPLFDIGCFCHGFRDDAGRRFRCMGRRDRGISHRPHRLGLSLGTCFGGLPHCLIDLACSNGRCSILCFHDMHLRRLGTRLQGIAALRAEAGCIQDFCSALRALHNRQAPYLMGRHASARNIPE